MTRRGWMWLAGIILGLVIIVIVVGFFIDEPLRRYAERAMNSRLQGYTVRLGKLDLHPLSFSVDLYDVAIMQNAHPEPPIVRVPRLKASVHWRALLSARVVSDVLVERPAVSANLVQIREETADDIPVQERGWQEAVQAVMPLKVNLLQVVDGQVTYIDAGPFEPLRISQLHVRARNIRNIESQAGVYPSDIHVEGTIFDSGKIWLDGQADFLAVPHAAVKAQLTLESIGLAYVKPIGSRYNIVLEGGTLSGTGDIEYAPTVKVIHLRRADIQGLQVDYVHTAQTARAERERADQLRMVKSEVGFVNKATDPDYRLFLTRLEVQVTNFSNQLAEGTMVARVTGQFMGSGQTVVGATFRPETKGPDFTLAASIENTQMRTMNRLLRAYGNLDVVQGFFSVYTEFRVKNGSVNGYAKPFIRDLNVYDPQQDREKGLFQKIYEGLVGGVSELLENVPREEIATEADISGPIENPQASTWQVLVNVIQNAFFETIFPGFERQLGSSRR